MKLLLVVDHAAYLLPDFDNKLVEILSKAIPVFRSSDYNEPPQYERSSRDMIRFEFVSDDCFKFHKKP